VVRIGVIAGDGVRVEVLRSSLIDALRMTGQRIVDSLDLVGRDEEPS
jgi:hypothetical protein